MITRITLLLIFLLIIKQSRSQEINIQTIKKIDGLQNDQIYRAYLAKDGRLWLATTTGVAVYDGNFVYNFGLDDGLSCSIASKIIEDENKTIWVSTVKGIYKLINNRFYKQKMGKFTDGTFTNLVFIQHKKYLCEKNGLLEVAHEHAIDSLLVNVVLKDTGVYNIFSYKNDLLLATHLGLFKKQKNVLSQIKLANDEFTDLMNSEFVVFNDTIYFGMRHLYIINASLDSATLIYNTLDPNLNRFITIIKNKIVYGFKQLKYIDNGLHKDFYYSLSSEEFDGGHNVIFNNNKYFIASEKGLCIIDDKIPVNKIKIPTISRAVRACMVGNSSTDGYVLFSGNTALQTIGITDINKRRIWDKNLNFLNTKIKDYSIDWIHNFIDNNYLYYTSVNKGIFRFNFDTKTIENYDNTNGFAESYENYYKRLDNSYLVFGEDFVEIKNNIVKKYEAPWAINKPSGLWVVCMLEFKPNEFIIGTRKGLYLVKNNQWIPVSKNINISESVIGYIQPISSTEFIVYSVFDGIYKCVIKNEKILLLDAYIPDKYNQLYYTEPIGLFANQLYCRSENKTFVFNINNFKQYAAFHEKNNFMAGGVLINVNKSGFSINDIDDNLVTMNIDSVNKYLQNNLCNGTFTSFRTNKIEYVDKNIPYSNHFVDIGYSFPNYSSQKIEKYFILISVDEKVIDTIYSYTNNVRIDFNSYGNYTVTINPMGVYYYKPAIMNFTVTKPWFLSWWFLTLSCAIFICLTYIFIRWRININNKKALEAQHKAELLQQVAESELIALKSQIEPHFIQNIFALIAAQIRKNDSAETSVELLQKTASWFGQVMELSDTTMHTVEDEINFLKQYLELQQKIKNNNFQYNIQIDKSIENPLHTSIPTMIVQPFVENAVKYAFPQSNSNNIIAVTFSILNNKLQAVIKDNGIGNSIPEYFSKSFAITKKRIELVTGGAGNIQINANNGFEVIITL